MTLKIQDLVRRGYLLPLANPRQNGYRLAPEQSSSEVPAGIPEVGASIPEVGASTPEAGTSTPEAGTTSKGVPTRQRRGWTPKEKQFEAVLGYCAGVWRTIGDIARFMGRSEATVRNDYLPPLLARGELKRRYPDNPRHPQQAYRSRR